MERRTILINGKYETWVKTDNHCPSGDIAVWRKGGTREMLCVDCERSYTQSAPHGWLRNSERVQKLRKDLSK